MVERFRSLYPHYDVLAKRNTPSWNDQTRAVIDVRLGAVPPRRFFTEAEWTTLVALCDRVIPQPERAEPVPITPWIDARLQEGHGSGTRFADLPPGPEAWRHGLAAIDAEAILRFGQRFHRLAAAEQDLILTAIDAGKGRAEAWSSLPGRKFFRHLVLITVAEIYYAHPAAWSEIGFGGPASPRGYLRLGMDRHDPWEAAEEDRGPVDEARR
ncbi:MAG TPA: gluconate 2-dehydrogenase subunit 3 family protein [Hyphomicrobiales bacterium]|nr:gluconate 2-dehydrogenase subunit 3 family protein [Hyphomicrobiales bacterium]